MSVLEEWRGGPGDRARHWRLTLTDFDAIRMEREQLEMISDGLWLIDQALKGWTEGPLSTPLFQLPIRVVRGE